jgi:nucleoid-associated protein YgaU
LTLIGLLYYILNTPVSVFRFVIIYNPEPAMRSRRSLIKFLIPAVSLVFILSCEIDVPVTEIITARAALESAKMFDAEKHAPEYIQKAEEHLLKSHDFIIAEKSDEAKKSANDALAAALEAEKKSLPPYASEKMKESEAAYISADQAYAEKFSPDKFTGAGKLNAEAKSFYENNDFKKSAEYSMKANELAVDARNDSLQNSSMVENEVTAAENKLTELKKDKFSSAAESNLANAGKSIDNAKKGMESRDYKTSLNEIDTAKKELDRAAELIRKQKISSTIQSLRAEMKELQGKSGSADVKQDLDNAMLELNGAEAALEQNNITDAELKVAQAEKLIRGSDVKMKKNSALAAIVKAEKLLGEAREKDAENKYKDNLDKAADVIVQGKSSIDSGKFNDGIISAEEAEAIISAVLNSMEAAAAELAVKAESDDHGEGDIDADAGEKDAAVIAEPEKKVAPDKTYVVQWRKKNTDCLWRIAETVYKDASFWPAIYLANRDQIKDPDLIFPGQKFIIPPKPQKKITYKEVKEQIKEKSK